MITGHTVERLNSGAIPSPLKDGPEGERQQPLNQSQDKVQTLRVINHRNTKDSQERSTAHQTPDQWRSNRHNRKQNPPLADHQPIVEGGI